MTEKTIRLLASLQPAEESFVLQFARTNDRLESYRRAYGATHDNLRSLSSCAWRVLQRPDVAAAMESLRLDRIAEAKREYDTLAGWLLRIVEQIPADAATLAEQLRAADLLCRIRGYMRTTPMPVEAEGELDWSLLSDEDLAQMRRLEAKARAKPQPLPAGGGT